MPSNYDKIREDNIREYGQGTRHLSFLGRLYTDQTHFVFELLQNAEDAGASRILFRLFDDRLEVAHDGRPFNEDDVRGVCGVGEGTKADDLTQIGKFGIGFKSVYAYTTRPEIHSGDESFAIKHYVRPSPVDPRTGGDSFTTLFVFPFDQGEISPETACREIGERLRKLSARTILFLRNVNEIAYELPDVRSGIYLREEVARGAARQVTVIGRNADHDEDEKWLIFERPVPTPDGRHTVRVEIGFRLETARNDRERVVKVTEAPLVVYFPTAKETGFGYLIQGPYRTTPARDNVPKDDDWNKVLIQETASLIAESLRQMKELGLMSVSLLEALPTRMADSPEGNMFYPIVDAVRNSLINEDLLPADDGTFVSARNARLASAEWLRQLLKDQQLRDLFNLDVDLRWISGEITERSRPELWRYLRDELEVDEVTPDSFARRIDHRFLERQGDAWMTLLYTHLRGQRALWKGKDYRWDEPGPLRAKPFIRLEDGRHVKPFRDGGYPNAYLPVASLGKASLPTVKGVLAEHEGARHFLTDLGIPELDVVAEVIEHVLPRYASQVPLDEHRHDIDKIVQAYKTDSHAQKAALKQKLSVTSFILTDTPGLCHPTYRKPGEVYFKTDDLLCYFSGNKDVGFVKDDYPEPVWAMLMDLGVSDQVRVAKKSPAGRGFICIQDCHSSHRRGLNGFDPNIHVEGLEHATRSPTLQKSAFIWNHIVVPNCACIRGTIERSRRQTFEDSEKEDVISKFGRLLMDTPWLICPDGIPRKPSELRLDDLPESFARDDNVATRLEMKKDVVARLAEEMGVPVDAITLIKQHPEEFERWRNSLLTREKAKPDFPTKTPASPERRTSQFDEALASSPEKEYGPRSRSVRTTRGAVDASLWLRHQYTNDDGVMVCQICRDEMPFKKRDGEYYFEAVEALSGDYFGKEHEAQFLALCPVCAAMYKEFVKFDEAAMRTLHSALQSSSDNEVPVMLGKLTSSIRFVETHFLDIKTILGTDE